MGRHAPVNNKKHVDFLPSLCVCAGHRTKILTKKKNCSSYESAASEQFHYGEGKPIEALSRRVIYHGQNI